MEGSPWGRLIALYVIFGLAHVLYIGVVNPDVLRHRAWPGKGTELWDWVWLAAFTPTLIAILIVAGLDINNEWALLSPWTSNLGVVLFVLGGGLFLRSMAENPFFEKTVRIQSERGHRVIDSGPYRLVRHPGYVGLVIWILSLPMVLTSAWAFIPTAIAIVSVVIRTALEDRTLHEKLPGYRDYAARVRSRLLPGVW